MAEYTQGICGECGGDDKDLIRTDDNCTYCAECLFEQVRYEYRSLGYRCEDCGDSEATYCSECASRCVNCGDTWNDLLCGACAGSSCESCGDQDEYMYCSACSSSSCVECGDESLFCSPYCAWSNYGETICTECAEYVGAALCPSCAEDPSPVLVAAEHIRINDTQVEVDGITFDFDT